MEFELLINECCNGSEKAWKSFIKQFHPLISAVVTRVCSEDSEDTAQLVYEKLINDNYRLLSEFRGGYVQFLLFIKRLSYNTALNVFKKTTRVSALTKNSDFDEELIADFSLYPKLDTDYDSEDIDRLKVAINELNPKYREIMTYLMKGYKNREIAEILNIPINTVLTRASRAKENLKKMLKNEIISLR
jgi:RNA polymerase sigma factor (sigma-70 family)